jgi:hypothetical protein
MHRHLDLTTGSVTLERSSDAAGRALHLVDIENLSGGPHRSPAEHLRAYRAYERRAEVRPGDQIVVAACGRVMASLAFGLPDGIARHCANGDDGADAVLLGYGTAEFIADRYERLVIGSGDHAFVGLAEDAYALGMTVLVVSGRGYRAGEFSGRGFGVRTLDLADDLDLIA